MATLAPQRISVTLPGDVSTFLRRRAKRRKLPLSKTVLEIFIGIMEDEDDPISEAEAKRLVARAEKNEAESTRTYTHEEFWALADKIPYDAGR